MDIKTIIDMISTHGWYTTLGSLLLYLGWTLINKSWFNNYISNIFNPKKETHKTFITDSDISNHDIFNYIDFWLQSKIPTIQFSSDYRTIIFRRYLSIYLKKHKENISKFITDKNYQSMDGSELWNNLLTLVNNISYDYEKEMEINSIPKVVIEKMKAKNNDTITLTIDLIEGVCNSGFYSSEHNLLKIYSTLNILLSILENTISNSEHVCNSINGQLKGMKISENGKTYIEPTA